MGWITKGENRKPVRTIKMVVCGGALAKRVRGKAERTLGVNQTCERGVGQWAAIKASSGSETVARAKANLKKKRWGG